MTETRPGELGRIDRQRIAQETADAIQHREAVDNERAFRERVLVALERSALKQDMLHDAFVEHVKLDDQRFSIVKQEIGGSINLKHIGMAVAIATSIAGAIAFVVWTVGLVTKP